MDIYICPNCEKKEEVDPISQKILQEKDYENVHRLVKSMQVHSLLITSMNGKIYVYIYQTWDYCYL